MSHQNLFPRGLLHIEYDGLYVGVEVLSVFGPAFETVAVCVDGVDRQTEHLRELGAVGNAEAHEGCYAQFGRHASIG